MKEKTFNDLLKPHQKRVDYHNLQRIYIDKADVLKLMQQVREATIAEVTQVSEDFGIGSGRPFIRHINNLQKDRILTDK